MMVVAEEDCGLPLPKLSMPSALMCIDVSHLNVGPRHAVLWAAPSAVEPQCSSRFRSLQKFMLPTLLKMFPSTISIQQQLQISTTQFGDAVSIHLPMNTTPNKQKKKNINTPLPWT
jgi:hypothetical protein